MPADFACRGVYAERTFNLDCSSPSVPAKGSPELLIQMLDKLVDDAVGFSSGGDTINIGLDVAGEHLGLGFYVANLIAEGHGGKITADNVEGGVRFEVRLPASN